MLVFLLHVWCNLIVVLICIFQMATSIEHLLVCLFAMLVSSKCLFKSFAQFSNWIVYFLIIELWEFIIYFRYPFFIWYVFWKYFLPVCGLSFHFLNESVEEQMFYISMKSSLSFCSFMICAFCVFSKNSVLNLGCRSFFLSVLIWKFYRFRFYT